MSFSSTSDNEAGLQKLLLSDEPNDALDNPVRNLITSSLWRSHYHNDTSVYFNYFQLQCDTSMRSNVVAIETYKDFLDLIAHMKRNRGAARSSREILEFFPPTSIVGEKPPYLTGDISHEQVHLPLRDRYPHCDPSAAEASIFLAVRLWLMINVGSLETNTIVPETSPEWPEGQSLDDLINSSFPECDLGPKLSQWPMSLNGCSLERIGGFEIVWTTNLADHLYLDEDTDRISVFHHVQVLYGLRHNHDPTEPLPDRLLLETLQTLALLIPRTRPDCIDWFGRVCNEGAGFLDKAAGDVKLLPWARSPENYKYWGQRLMVIKNAYDVSEPKRLGQWWHDRRRKVQWYTFWVAILVLVLTIVFGLIQSVTGVMQVYYATHPVQQPD